MSNVTDLPDVITIRLTSRQLTAIRVAVLTRIMTVRESLRQNPDDRELQQLLAFLEDLMKEGGVLYEALLESIRRRDIR